MSDPKSVILVDDNTDFLAIAAEALDMLGYDVTAISDPEDALAQAAEAMSCDVLIVDYCLSATVSGMDVAQRARTLSPDLPILFLTGDAGQVETVPEHALVVDKTAGFVALRDALVHLCGATS